MTNPQQTQFFVRVRGARSGYTLRAPTLGEAREIATRKLALPENSTYISIGTKPTLGRNNYTTFPEMD